MKAFFGHLKTILTHKWWVFYYCCKLGIPWQGLWHDMSKFSPIEFIESVKYYQGGKSSPITAAKKQNGFSKAWIHHYRRNKHHFEYWIYNHDTETFPIEMPYKYVLELVADYLAAGRTYQGKTFTIQDESDWWNNKIKNNPNLLIHPKTKDLITQTLWTLRNGDDYFNLIKFNKVFYQ